MPGSYNFSTFSTFESNVFIKYKNVKKKDKLFYNPIMIGNILDFYNFSMYL